MATQRLGDMAVGSTIKIGVNGTLTDFIIVNQGIPGNSALYDSSCNGTWVLMKDIYEMLKWDTERKSGALFPSSEIKNYLSNTFYALIDPKIRAKIRTARIPYVGESNNDAVVISGSDGLALKIFLLSTFEVNSQESTMDARVDGARLSYFLPGTSSAALNNRIASYNGIINDWWLRTPYLRIRAGVFSVMTSGRLSYSESDYVAKGVRPAFILPMDLTIGEDGQPVFNSAPTTPPSITLPATINSQEDFTVTWGASTDPDGNLSGYQLGRSTDGGAYTQVYQGAALSYTDNLPYGTQNVAYRVRAYDTEGEYSGYRTSSSKTVINNLPPTAPASITVPTPVAGHTIAITWGEATDPDGTVESYQLERSVNNSGWVQIYSGPALTYTDTVGGGWGTVAYRVRAVDDKGAAGPYLDGESYTVQNDILYISGPAPEMGAQPKPFTFTFGVGISGSAEAVDNVSVTALLDGYGIYTGNITSAQSVSLSIDVRAIGAGEHTIHVTADRPLSIGAKEDYSFTVAETVVPAGGYGTLLQDNTGAAVFPQTTAGLVAGLKGRSVGENLAELFAAIEAMRSALAAGLALYKEDLENEE